MDEEWRTTMAAMIEELDHRESNGIAVSLLWDRRTDTLTVRVLDRAEDEALELECAAGEALEVFQHPYAYAEVRPVLYRHVRARG